MNLTINQRFNLAVEGILEQKKAANKKDIALKLQVSSSYITELLKSRLKLSIDFIQKFCIVFDINPMFFFDNTDNTPVYKINSDVALEVNERLAPYLKNEKLHPKLHPTLHPNQKNTLPAVVTVDPSGNENVVLVNIKARAGYLDGYGDVEYIQKLPTYSLPGLNCGTFRAFEVGGDSMNPTLEDKEVVICQWVENTDYIKNDHIHVIVSKKDGIVIKRLLNCISKYGYITAKSDANNNKNLYANFDIYPEDIEEIWHPIMHINPRFKSPDEIHNRMNNIEIDLEEIKKRLGI